MTKKELIGLLDTYIEITNTNISGSYGSDRVYFRGVFDCLTNLKETIEKEWK